MQPAASRREAVIRAVVGQDFLTVRAQSSFEGTIAVYHDDQLLVRHDVAAIAVDADGGREVLVALPPLDGLVCVYLEPDLLLDGGVVQVDRGTVAAVADRVHGVEAVRYRVLAAIAGMAWARLETMVGLDRVCDLIYLSLLDRRCDPGGRSHFEHRRARGESYQTIIRDILMSPEHAHRGLIPGPLDLEELRMVIGEILGEELTSG